MLNSRACLRTLKEIERGLYTLPSYLLAFQYRPTRHVSDSTDSVEHLKVLMVEHLKVLFNLLIGWGGLWSSPLKGPYQSSLLTHPLLSLMVEHLKVLISRAPKGPYGRAP